VILLQLFLSFAKIGLFAFGGGYATLVLIEQEIVISMHWLSHSEFLDVITISQLTPGPIAINAATFVGYKVNGIPGSIVATLAFCLPSLAITFILTRFLAKYESNTWVNSVVRGLRPAVIALIAAAAYSIIAGRGIMDVKGIVIAAASFVLLRTRKVDSILVLILAGAAGIVVYGLF
jgi:chromate transporter